MTAASFTTALDAERPSATDRLLTERQLASTGATAGVLAALLAGLLSLLMGGLVLRLANSVRQRG